MLMVMYVFVVGAGAGVSLFMATDTSRNTPVMMVAISRNTPVVISFWLLLRNWVKGVEFITYSDFSLIY